MRILHISSQSDIRAFKQAVVMLDRGHEVEIAIPFAQFFGFNKFTCSYLYSNGLQLEQIIKRSQADIVHVHSDPNSLVVMVKSLAGDRPVVHDVHDPTSMRKSTKPDNDEIHALRDVDGLIHVSQGCRSYCEQVHGADKPTTVIYSALPEFYYKSARNANFNAIAYEGGLTSLERNTEGAVYYRNQHYFVNAFIEQGYQVSLFAAGDTEIDMSYEKMGALVTRDLHYSTMLNGLRLHGFGWVGTPAETPLLKAAMPNKLFDYISQGVVPVCWNCDEAGQFVEERGIGIWLKGDLVNLRERLKDGYRIREKLLRDGRQFAMESQAEQLESFYRALI